VSADRARRRKQAPGHVSTIQRPVSARSRINRRLLEAATYPVVLIIAPAGFGKTTALRHFLTHHEGVIFVNTPLATTLERFIHAFSRECSQHFPEMASPPSASAVDASDGQSELELYSAWASKHLRGVKCTIVIDDLQHADNVQSVAAFLERITDQSKDYIKWVFSSRTHGALPVMRWQAYGDADATVTADDLRMTIDDAVEIAASLSSPVNVKQLGLLVEQTRGFPVPIAYAIRLSARRGSIVGITEGTRAFTFSFLAEQLWVSLTDSQRDLLEVCAFLPAIHMHDYENGGFERASHIISHLCDDIAFLTITPAGIFSMHDLFRDFVKLQVSKCGPTKQQERCDSAVRILMNSGHYNEGFELLIDSCDTLKLMDAVEKFSSNITDLSVTHRVACATEHVMPAKLRLETLYLQTEYWSWFDEPHKSRQFAEELIQRTDAPSRHLLCAFRSIFRIIDTRTAQEQLEWLSRMPEIIGRLNERDSTQAYACQASLLARFPETQSEAHSLVRQVQRKIDVLDSLAQVNAQIALASAFHYLGDNEAALRATSEAVAAAKAVNNVREIARTLNSLGLMLMCVFDRDVELVFAPLRDAVERTGSWRFSHISHWFQAAYQAWKGDVNAALLACDLQLAIIPSEVSSKARLKAVQRHSRNLCHFLNGDFQAIVTDYELAGVPKDGDIAYEILVETAAAYAFISNAAACDRALKSAKQLRDSLPDRSFSLLRQAFFIEIIALCISGHWSKAKRLDEQYRNSIPALASFGEIVSRFCLGPPFVSVIDELDRHLGQPYVGLIALLMKRIIQSNHHLAEIPLTETEIEVLQLLALGRSNKEIASARHRSPETIKRQISSIYKKLSVDNRTGAVVIAKEHGLLQSK
jgi:ATP/maltotriose-dependent transcriptional regulator MalT